MLLLFWEQYVPPLEYEYPGCDDIVAIKPINHTFHNSIFILTSDHNCFCTDDLYN